MKLLEAIMKRDNLSIEEAKDLIEEAREDLYNRLEEGEMPHNICEEWFGLEPDYLIDLM